ncbi:bifunctional 2',3'-cyclic-nucleotide 2'-phosphodiesterase/3'-nucleotidase [Metabacillus sp. RGM 3146]|uniref:bifunctional 2',3'-cyclic-nucleotide 2'-phosphodiesterase/3'-nucleotidase n=1 Tax=Metabacillus sp. RGM 3146 TaxID=3401092 RepID=UPI003B9994EA
MKRRLLKISMAMAVAASAFAIPFAIPFASSSSAHAETSPLVKLRLMETSDIHDHIMDYDYYGDSATEKFGLARTATLIQKMRSEAKNSILVDNGDLIQGNPMAEYMVKVKPLKAGDVHPVFKAMNLLNYDMATLGNHEFNYGLDFLKEAYNDANFPYVNANVYTDDKDKDPSNDKNYFIPYQIKEKVVKDENGQDQTIKIGYLGLVTPQITTWDKGNLEGKVITKDIVETAKTFVPKMRADGADLVVVLAHTGIDTVEHDAGAENAVYDLAMKVPGIDAIVSGHQHNIFPGDARFNNVANIDTKKGTINNIPVVMPKNWGSHLGVIDMDLSKADGKWKITNSQSTASPIYDAAAKKSLAERYQPIIDAVKSEHEGTLDFIRKEVGQTTAPINSYFALEQDDPSIQIVNDAQRWFAKDKLKGTEYANLPILSAAAPFKAGGRMGADYYTNISSGKLAIKNIGDLYLYDNTLQVVKLKGSDVKNWLEMSAGAFNQIDPAKSEEQSLLNLDFPSYNYDVIDGVTYQIDVTQPAKYDKDGKVVNANASRIVNLKYNGKAIDPNQDFLVATNNYRASGGGYFPGLNGSNIVYKAPDENRQALLGYMEENKTINPSADQNWSLAGNAANAKITFESSSAAKEFASASKSISYNSESENGFSKYSIKLEKPAEDTKMAVQKYSVGRIIIKKPVNIMKMKEDGTTSLFRSAKPGEALKIFGSDEHMYNVGGSYYVKRDSSTVEYTGRILIKEAMPLYNAEGKVTRTIKKGESVHVFGMDQDHYLVGGGYYVSKNRNAVYYEGFAKLTADTALWMNGKEMKMLKKGNMYRVYGVKDNMLMVGGGYSIHGGSSLHYSKN